MPTTAKPRAQGCPAPECNYSGQRPALAKHAHRVHGQALATLEANRRTANWQRAFIKRHFGMTEAEYTIAARDARARQFDRLYAEDWVKDTVAFDESPDAKCVCDICGRIGQILGLAIYPEGSEVLSLDHCHDSNKIRGILCRKCNTGLGQLGDTVEALEAALAYLKRLTA